MKKIYINTKKNPKENHNAGLKEGSKKVEDTLGLKS